MNDKETIVVDIDGTMSLVGDRLKYIQESPKNWEAFYEHCPEDLPNQAVTELVSMLFLHYNVVFCTGRPERTRDKTLSWLRAVLNESGSSWDIPVLLMRADGDHSVDSKAKPRLLADAGYSPDNVTFILEDRSSVVQRWRELGFTCFQVANGNF